MGELAIVLFLLIIFFILSGYPVAFVLGGLSTIFGLIVFGLDFFLLLPSRLMGVMSNYVLLAVPLFIFMGVMLEKSGLARRLLQQMGILFGQNSGGLALGTLFVGVLLSASTGIVGATVIAMGMISLPVMLHSRYDHRMATGTILAAGTLGQIIPPSIVLVLLGSVMQISVGKLFAAAVIPSILLVTFYALFIIWKSRVTPLSMPPVNIGQGSKTRISSVLFSLFPPLLLIVLVLGSIFSGLASPTEAAGLGAAGSILLAACSKGFQLIKVRESLYETTLISAMVFFILFGATTFSLVFRGLGGDEYLTSMVTGFVADPVVFLLLVMIILFIAGFFIDFIEIIFIFLPVLLPLFESYGFDLIWLAILIAINLQTSFLTPPFGFALFYLRGVAPKEVKSMDLYRGAIPFLIIQLIVLLLVWIFPDLISSRS